MSGKTPELFSFSFLDILACTVGAVLFVLMVMALQLSEVTPQALPLEERDRLLREREELEAELEALQAAGQLEELQRLREEADALSRARSSLSRALSAAKAEAAAKEKALGGKRRKTVDLGAIRPKPVKETRLVSGIDLICVEDGVEVVSPVVGLPSGDPPTRTVRLERVSLTLTDRIGSSGTDLDRRLRSLDPRAQFAGVMVRDKGIGAFRRLRAHLKQRGFEVAWQPLPIEGREFKIRAAGSSGGGARTD